MSLRASAVWACVLALTLIAGCGLSGHTHTRYASGPSGEPIDVGDSTSRWIISGPVSEPGLFDEVLFSWDVRTAENTGARLEARVRRGDDWSSWMTIARRGEPLEDDPIRSDALARVDVDMIVCASPCDAVAWRVTGVGRVSPDVRDMWVTTTAVGAGERLRSDDQIEPILHEVPHKAQRDAGEELGGRLCSPTSVAMVAAFRGVDVSVTEMARLAYDEDFDLYGNWVNNTRAASELGVPMRVTRIGSWAEARHYLEHGPIVISLPPFDERELTGSGYSSRSGHLIVVAGLDDAGGVIVRDPAHAEGDRRVYRRSQLTRLWLAENKGTAYVLTDR